MSLEIGAACRGNNIRAAQHRQQAGKGRLQRDLQVHGSIGLIVSARTGKRERGLIALRELQRVFAEIELLQIGGLAARLQVHIGVIDSLLADLGSELLNLGSGVERELRAALL